jgi:hypothetical protein
MSTNETPSPTTPAEFPEPDAPAPDIDPAQAPDEIPVDPPETPGSDGNPAGPGEV